MHRLATVHARDKQPTNQPTPNDQRRHDTAVEFYLYPTVSTALVHSVKPKLTE